LPKSIQPPSTRKGAIYFQENKNERENSMKNRGNAFFKESPTLGEQSTPEPLEPPQPLFDEVLPESARRIIWLLRRLVQAGELYSKFLLKNYNVTQHQLACLLALSDSGPLPQSKLANAILVKPSTITGVIDRLEQKGLVVRERDVKDRRVVSIRLTDAGQELVNSAPPPIQRSLIDGLKGLSNDENSNIKDSLERLVAMLDTEF
jgi:DNA-binding MarR family transcriptional regulator